MPLKQRNLFNLCCALTKFGKLTWGNVFNEKNVILWLSLSLSLSLPPSPSATRTWLKITELPVVWIKWLLSSVYLPWMHLAKISEKSEKENKKVKNSNAYLPKRFPSNTSGLVFGKSNFTYLINRLKCEKKSILRIDTLHCQSLTSQKFNF